MKIIIAENYEHLSRITVQHLLGYMFQDRRVNLAITGGNTPQRAYELLVEEVKDRPYFSHVHYYNFDELHFLSGQREGITISDLRRLYLTPAGVAEENIHKLDQNNYSTQDARIAADGGLDLVLLGMGADGHFCGNMPGVTAFANETYRVDYDDEMKKSVLPLYAGAEEDMPSYYVTMGPRSIMNARHLLMIVNGKNKAAMVKRVLTGSVEPSVPSSILTLHPHITFVLDQDAASLL